MNTLAQSARNRLMVGVFAALVGTLVLGAAASAQSPGGQPPLGGPPGAPPRGAAAPAPGPATAAPLPANGPGSGAANPNAAPIKAGEEVVADQIVAVVNNEVITRNELNRRRNDVVRILSRQGTQLPPRDILDRQVLEQMINEKAQVQEAKDDGVKIDDRTLDNSIQRIADQNKMTLVDFRKRVENEGSSWAGFREDVRNEIAMQRLREHEVDANVQVSENEIDNFVAAQTGGDAVGYEVDLGHILIRLPEQATPDQIDAASKKADDVYNQLVGGADFAKTAVSFSDAPDALKSGGEMGYKPEASYPQLFLNAAAGLTAGQVGKPVRSPAGFHIIKLIGRRRAVVGKNTVAPQTQTHVRHILLRINEVTSAEQAKQRLTDIRNRILAGSATFEDMARSYSNDGTASRGGDLGTVYPGDTIPEFERIMNALKVGEISEPVQTPFGMHIIQVLDRKTGDVPDARVRLMARAAIHERKAEEAYQEWARSLRDRAYVEMRLDEH